MKELKALFRYLHLLIHVNISLFHWVHFTSFFDLYVEQNICFYSLGSSHWDIVYQIAFLNQCKEQRHVIQSFFCNDKILER